LTSRSVHNIRIERLWLELNRVLGTKWKRFFEALEEDGGLNIDSAGHIWLLHHLFLESVNRELLGWAEHWNAHTMQLKYERNQSPREMFMMGVLDQRAPGVLELIRAQEEGIADTREYGVDFEAMNDEELMNSLLEREENPFTDHLPNQFSEVVCEPPDCPMHPTHIEGLDQVLDAEYDIQTRSMDIRKLMWVRALEYCAGHV
jgi:hypothetical protein